MIVEQREVNVFVDEGLSEEIACWILGKHKLSQLCFPQSNLCGDGSGAQGQEMKGVVGAVTHSVSLSLSLFPFPHSSYNVNNAMDTAIVLVIIILETQFFPLKDFIRNGENDPVRHTKHYNNVVCIPIVWVSQSKEQEGCSVSGWWHARVAFHSPHTQIKIKPSRVAAIKYEDNDRIWLFPAIKRLWELINFTLWKHSKFKETS